MVDATTTIKNIGERLNETTNKKNNLLRRKAQGVVSITFTSIDGSTTVNTCLLGIQEVINVTLDMSIARSENIIAKLKAAKGCAEAALTSYLENNND